MIIYLTCVLFQIFLLRVAAHPKLCQDKIFCGFLKEVSDAEVLSDYSAVVAVDLNCFATVDLSSCTCLHLTECVYWSGAHVLVCI